MRFYLGCHVPAWGPRHNEPLFISRPRIIRSRSRHRMTGPWAMDSGGFTEITMKGGWFVPASQYASEAREISESMGRPDFIAPQDWMCEEIALARTGKTILEHQRLTVNNYLDLRELAPELPWIPVLQGYTLGEYFECYREYELSGVNLASLPRVGLGSICRRQATTEAVEIVKEFHRMGVKLHGFGFKFGGILACHSYLESCDSLAWSLSARKNDRLPECAGGPHLKCSNCARYALQWRGRLLATINSRGGFVC